MILQGLILKTTLSLQPPDYTDWGSWRTGAPRCCNRRGSKQLGARPRRKTEGGWRGDRDGVLTCGELAIRFRLQALAGSGARGLQQGRRRRAAAAARRAAAQAAARAARYKGGGSLYGGRTRCGLPRRRRGLRAQMGPARACGGGAG
jgi:hypothetical protein